MNILGNRTTFRLMILMEELAEPIAREHQHTAVQLKTCMGNRDWVGGMASGAYTSTYLKDMVIKVCSGGFWRSAGFMMDLKPLGDDDFEASPSAQEDLLLADTVADMLCALLYGELQNCRHFEGWAQQPPDTCLQCDPRSAPWFRSDSSKGFWKQDSSAA